MINSDLLKEAIADAKAVRVTALANATAALQEAFAPRFHAMFAEKLKEEAEEQEESAQVAEVEAPHSVSKAVHTKDVTKGQPKKMHSGKGFKAVKAGEGPKDVPNLHQPVCETEKVAEVGAEGVEENVEEAGLTSEDLDQIIKELEAEVASEAEGEEPVAAEPHVDVPVAEVPPVDAEPHVDVPVAGADECGCGEPHVDVPVASPVASPDEAPMNGGDEEINLEELLASLNQEGYEEDMDENKDKWIQKAVNPAHKGDCTPMSKPSCTPHKKALAKRFKSGDLSEMHHEEDEMNESSKENGMPAPDQGQAKDKAMMPKAKEGEKNHKGSSDLEHTPKMHEAEQTALVKENKELKSTIQEYVKTIEFLRGEMNEVNLLNAKLLFTNKLFKEFAGVLDDAKRMKIVEHFDLTKTVREVKLAYACLAESLSFGAKPAVKANEVPVKKPTTVVPTAVKQITEGLASKPVASTKPSKDIITEGANEMASRFKKLAGIKTPSTKK